LGRRDSLFGIYRHVLLAQKPRRADRDDLAREEAHHVERRTRRRRTLAHREVDPVRMEARHRLGRKNPQLDLRMRVREGRQVGDQPLRSEGGRNAHQHHAGPGAQGLRRGPQVAERRGDPPVVAASGGRVSQSLGQALEEGQPEMRLERAHLLRDRALRHAQLLGGGAERQMATGGIEGAQSVERGKIGHERTVFLLSDGSNSNAR
jgi:hypothetical protein